MTWRIRKLGRGDDRGSFDCGVPALDDWLKQQAGQAVKKNLASVWVPVQAVLVHAKDDRAAGFYRKFGFIAFADQPLHLYLPIGTVRALAAAVP